MNVRHFAFYDKTDLNFFIFVRRFMAKNFANHFPIAHFFCIIRKWLKVLTHYRSKFLGSMEEVKKERKGFNISSSNTFL